MLLMPCAAITNPRRRLVKLLRVRMVHLAQYIVVTGGDGIVVETDRSFWSVTNSPRFASAMLSVCVLQMRRLRPRNAKLGLK